MLFLYKIQKDSSVDYVDTLHPAAIDPGMLLIRTRCLKHCLH